MSILNLEPDLGRGFTADERCRLERCKLFDEASLIRDFLTDREFFLAEPSPERGVLRPLYAV